MGYISNTPESQAARLGRKDSLDFDKTCAGISPTTGLPCRRGLTTNAGQAPTRGIVTKVNGRELFFCGQHKEQARDLMLKHSSDFQKRRQQMGRSSIDTLVEKVEVVVGRVPTGNGGSIAVQAQSTTKVDPKVGSLGITTISTVPLDSSGGEKQRKAPRLLRFLCCAFSSGRRSKFGSSLGTISEEQENPGIARPAQSSQGNLWKQGQVKFNSIHLPPRFPLMSVDGRQQGPSAISGKLDALAPKPGAVNQASNSRRPHSNEHLIPPHLPADTAIRIWEELQKPFSEKDEPGYIYVFLLTDKPLTPAPTAAAAASPTRFLKAAAAHSPASNQKLLLKIGRAVNVQRRLHQWTEQCSYSLSLMRFYPYTPAHVTPRQVPNSHRIERLIHLELRSQNRVIECDKCGKTHLEWFEVDASREGLREVNRVITKWVEFGEREVGRTPEQYLKGVKKPDGAKISPAQTPAATTPQKTPPAKKTSPPPTKADGSPGKRRPANQNKPPAKSSPPAKKPTGARPKAPRRTNGAGKVPTAIDLDSDLEWESGDDEIVEQGRKMAGKGRGRGKGKGRG